MARLILDTGALIALERADQTDDSLNDGDDVAIAAVTAAELLVGVELADSQRHAERETFVEGVLERVQIISYDAVVARHHAALLAHVRRAGRPPRGARSADRRHGTRQQPHRHHHRPNSVLRSTRSDAASVWQSVDASTSGIANGVTASELLASC